jgi:flagellar operon protein
MDTLSQRGSRQSLVMLDQYAYVVNVPTHTVVTAVEPNQSKERVFTQIDSVIIA